MRTQMHELTGSPLKARCSGYQGEMQLRQRLPRDPRDPWGLIEMFAYKTSSKCISTFNLLLKEPANS